MKLGRFRREQRVPMPSSAWIEFFRASAAGRLPLPWDDGPQLTPEDRGAVAATLVRLKRERATDKSYLMRLVHRHAFESGDGDYATAARMMLDERRRHADELGRYVVGVGLSCEEPLPRANREQDALPLRSRRAFEAALAEMCREQIVALVAIRVLRRVTRCSLLHAICDRILDDDAHHLAFNAERVALLRRRNQRSPGFLDAAAFRSRVFVCAISASLLEGGALRAAGWSRLRYIRQCWHESSDVLRRMSPTTYVPVQQRARIDPTAWEAMAQGRAVM